MYPVNFEGANCIYGQGQEQYQPLPAYKVNDEQGQVLTFWRPTDEELEILNNGGHIGLSVFTFYNHLQPVLLYVTDELEELKMSTGQSLNENKDDVNNTN